MNEHIISSNSLLSQLSPLGGNPRNAEIENQIKLKDLTVFDFTIGDPLEPTPNFILENLHSHITQVSQYPLTNGLPELHMAVSKWCKRRFNVDVNHKNQIISSNGSKEAVFHVPQILINHQSKRNTIVFPEPGYPIFKSGTIMAGGTEYQLPLNPDTNYIFDPDDIPKDKITDIVAVWVCYPHNPTGAQITKSHAEKIYHWALKNGIVLLSDECYIDMYFDENNPPVSFLEIAQKTNFKNLLTFFSLSKRSGMTGYRSGCVVGDENLISIYAKFRHNVGVGTPTFIQHAAISAWEDDTHVKERCRIFYQKRSLVEEFLLRNKFHFLKSSATFYMWVSIPDSYESANEFCNDVAKNAGIFMTPGEMFGPSCKKYFRLALVPTIEEISNALKVWQNAIDVGEFK